MNRDFLDRLTQRALTEHGLDTSHRAIKEPLFDPLLIASEAHPLNPPHDQDEQSEDGEQDDVHMLDPAGDSSDHQASHSEHTALIPIAGSHLEDPQGPPDDAEDEDDDATTDSEEEYRPKKRDQMPTIRLSLQLSTAPIPITVEASVATLAKDAGYVLPEDPAIALGVPSLPEPEPDYAHDGGPPPKRRRRKRRQERDEGYDRDDPFVDDSEALMTEPKFYHAPARDGFFVVEGLLELKADTNKKKGRKPSSKIMKRVPLVTTFNSDSPKPLQSPVQTHTPPLSKATQHGNNETLSHTEAGQHPRLLESRPSLPRPNNGAPEAIHAGSPRENHLETLNSTRSIDPAILPNQCTPNIEQPPSSSQTANMGGCFKGDTVGDRKNPINLADEDDELPGNVNPLALRQSSQNLNIKGSKPSEIPDLRQSEPRNSFQSDTSLNPNTSGPRRHSLPQVNQARPDTVSEIDNLAQSEIPAQPIVTSAPAPDVLSKTGSSAAQPPRPSYLRARPGPPRKKEAPIAPELQAAIQKLKIEVDAALPFAPKQFPKHLIPLTLEVAQLALDLCEFDIAFFHRLAEIFPYNTFTIRKLVTREILPQRQKYYKEQIRQRIELLEPLIEDAMIPALNEYQRNLEEYELAMKKWNMETAARESKEANRSNLSTFATIAKNQPNGSPFQPSMEFEGPTTTDLAGDNFEAKPKPPAKNNFKFTFAMRELYYEILKLEDEQCEVIQSTQSLCEKNVTLKDISNRKQLYQKLVKIWPDGFMTTTRLSREAATVRKKFETSAEVSKLDFDNNHHNRHHHTHHHNNNSNNNHNNSHHNNTT